LTVGGRGGWLIDHSTHLCKRTSRFPLTTKRDTVRPAPTGSLWTVSQSSRRSSSECMAADANRLCPEYRAETTQGSSQDTWQRPPPRQSRIRARKHAASDVVDAEVSAEVRRASGSTNQEPRHRHQISADALLLRAVQGAEQQQARRGSVGERLSRKGFGVGGSMSRALGGVGRFLGPVGRPEVRRAGLGACCGYLVAVELGEVVGHHQ